MHVFVISPLYFQGLAGLLLGGVLKSNGISGKTTDKFELLMMKFSRFGMSQDEGNTVNRKVFFPSSLYIGSSILF